MEFNLLKLIRSSKKDQNKFRIPRIWSNRELKKFSKLFSGDVVNISGWKDIDKEGNRYKDYFSNSARYFISNYKKESKGFQGDLDNEFYLDLEKELPNQYNEKFDVVFNHTTLEHVFEVFIAFENLCKISKDIVIIIVPFLQEQHAEYGDFWRFTPLTIDRLFKKNNMELLYINYNDNKKESIYIFAIGSKKSHEWSAILDNPGNKVKVINEIFIGTKIIK